MPCASFSIRIKGRSGTFFLVDEMQSLVWLFMLTIGTSSIQSLYGARNLNEVYRMMADYNSILDFVDKFYKEMNIDALYGLVLAEGNILLILKM